MSRSLLAVFLLLALSHALPAKLAALSKRALSSTSTDTLHVPVFASSLVSSVSVSSITLSSSSPTFLLSRGQTITVSLPTQAGLALTWSVDGLSNLDPSVGKPARMLTHGSQTFSTGILVARLVTPKKFFGLSSKFEDASAWVPIATGPSFTATEDDQVLQMAAWGELEGSGMVFPIVTYSTVTLLTAAPATNIVGLTSGLDGVIYINPGIKLSVTVMDDSATWVMGNDTVTADGSSTDSVTYVGVTRARGALVVRAGLGDWQVVGTSGYSSSKESGALFLASWDNSASGHEGSLAVSITLYAAGTFKNIYV